MQSFTYQNQTKLIFGEGAVTQCGELARSFGQRILVCAYGDKATASILDTVCRSLKEAGLDCQLLTGIKPNPSLDCIEEGIRIVREKNIDFLLAVGGGSVIDTAKSIAVGVYFEGAFWDLVGNDHLIERMMPMGCVVTIPAAGSESSLGLCVTNPAIQAKCTISADVMRPNFAILDPCLTYTLPAYQTFCGAADILSHLMERYFTSVPHNDLTDRLLEGAMKSLIVNTDKLKTDLNDHHARAEIMFCSTLAQNDILGAGREADWGCHYIAALISGAFDTTHGAALALITPWWAEYVLMDNPEIFAQFARRVMDVPDDFGDTVRIAREGIRRMRLFFDSLSLPARLSDLPNPLAASKEGIDAMVACYIRDFGSIGSIRRIYAEDVRAILERAR